MSNNPAEKYGEYAITKLPSNWLANADWEFRFSFFIDKELDGSPLRWPITGSHCFYCNTLKEAKEKLDRGFLVLARKKTDYNSVYFVSDKVKGGLTRNVKEARIFSLKESYMFFNNSGDVMLQKPLYDWTRINGEYGERNEKFRAKFFLYDIWENSDEAQKKIDEQYPPRRKALKAKERKEVYDKCQGHCAYCGKEISLKEMQVDHIIPHMYMMGKDEMENYLPSCRDCNQAKGADPLEIFRASIKNDFYKVYAKRKTPQNWLSDRITRAYGLDKDPDKKIIFYFEKDKK